MGYALDWVSVKGLAPEEVLSHLGLADTGEPTDWPDEGEFMWAITPQGRIVVVANRLGWFGPARLSGLSSGAEAVASSADENACWSGAWGYSDGIQAWSVIHDQAGHDGDLTHMETEGDVPDAFTAIHARLLADLKADTGRRPADHLFEAPQDLAALLGGWRPESLEYDDLEFFEAEIVSEIADDRKLSYRPHSSGATPSWKAALKDILPPSMTFDMRLSLFGLVPALVGMVCSLGMLVIPLLYWNIEGRATFLIGGVIVVFLSLGSGVGILSFQGFSSQILACAVSALAVGPMFSMGSTSPVWPALAWGVVVCGGLGLVGTLIMRLRGPTAREPA